MSLFTSSQRMGTAAIVLGTSIFASRFMGLARDKVISYYYGTGAEADVYMASFVVPDFINYLLAGGYFAITLIPLMARKFQEGEDEGWAFFSAVFWWVCIASSAIVALAWLFAPELARVTAPGFADAPEMHDRLTFFLRIVLPAQIFFLPGACLSALLFRRRQFTAPALIPLVYNGCIITCGTLMAIIAPERGMEGFCWGVVAGSFFGAFLLPFVVAKAGGLHLRPVLANKGMVAFILLALPLMLGQSIAVVDEQLIRVFGSLAGVGGVSQLVYARRFMFVPIGIVGQAAGAASYPFLAGLAASGEEERFAATVNTVLKNTLAIAVPACVWMAAIAEPLIRLLFEQGRFTPADTAMCAHLLTLMLPGVLFWVAYQLVSRSFYAHEDTLTPAVIGTATTLLFLPVYWVLSKFFGASGVAVAGVLGIGTCTLVMAAVWKRRRGGAAFAGLIPHMGRATIVAAIPGLAAYCLTWLVTSLLPAYPMAGAALALATGGVAFAGLYLGLAYLFAPALLDPLAAVLGKLAARRQNKNPSV